ncbi:MAG: phosphate ABC transporter permease subunit PstC [Methanomicrobiales archaeon]|nr:phosphate ABC transporter permease subunit PstC [Methanomicrobiales archaeon]
MKTESSVVSGIRFPWAVIETGASGVSEGHGWKYRKDRLIKYLLFAIAFSAVAAVFFILVFLVRDGYHIFLQTGLPEFILGSYWNPTGEPPSFGIFPLIVGTFLVTIGAMCISVPLSLGSAIFISYIAPPGAKRIIKPAIELLAGIPSVIYGFFGLILLTDWIRIFFDQPSGSSWLAGSILLAIMALPTITSVAEDAISSVPKEYIEGSLAIGATRWQTIRGVILPTAVSGILAAVILGFGRAIGETMAVLMVTGNAAIVPEPIYNVFSPIRTLTGTLGIEMGEVAFGSIHYHALFGIAVVLLVITLGINLFATFIFGRLERRGGERRSMAMSFWREWLKRRVRIDRLTGGARAVLFAIPIVVFILLIFDGAPRILLIPLTGMLSYTFLAGTFGGRRLDPRKVEKAVFAILTLIILLVLAILGIILGEIVVKGAGAISWDFITQAPRDLGRAGGIFPAIVGTIYLVAGAVAFALPLGIGSAVFLVEYTKESSMTKTIRTAVDLLAGTPSIVFGLFGFAFLVLFLRFGISMIAGQITLGLMILPTVIRTTEEALKVVPASLREGSYALGATKWETIRRVVLPSAIHGILTGAILSIGRAAGETAPIMFTAVVFSTRFLPSSAFDPVMALPYHLFILTTTVPDGTANKYGTAFVLLLLVVSFYLVAIVIRERQRRRFA